VSNYINFGDVVGEYIYKFYGVVFGEFLHASYHD